jgi:chorismate synthase
MSNSLGKLFTITSFGESHGRVVGIVVDGCPAGLAITEKDIQRKLDKRKSGEQPGTTARKEADRVEVLSGVFEGRATGAPICLLAWNRDVDSSDYQKMRFVMRPSHADYTAYIKYGGFNDFRGGGRFSGRITVGFVMAGAIAGKVLDIIGVEVMAHTVAVGDITARPAEVSEIRRNAGLNRLHCADSEGAEEMMKAIERARQEGDSLGGIIEGVALGLPSGLGEPVFDTLDGELARALFAIPAVKGVEYGSGFQASRKRGSENNDPFIVEDGRIVATSNNAGGVLGGVSSGMPLVVRVAVKPTASIARRQKTVDIKEMKGANLKVTGRHDACIVPRAVVVVESMMAITLCDLALRAGLLPGVIK